MNALPTMCYLMLLWGTIDLSFVFSEGNLTLFKSGSVAIKAHILLTAPCCWSTQAPYSVCPDYLGEISQGSHTCAPKPLPGDICKTSGPLWVEPLFLGRVAYMEHGCHFSQIPGCQEVLAHADWTPPPPLREPLREGLEPGEESIHSVGELSKPSQGCNT